DVQGQNGGTRHIVDAGDALEPALPRGDELKLRLGARAERAGVDMDIGQALPVVHEGPREAVHMPQDARDGLVLCYLYCQSIALQSIVMVVHVVPATYIS